MYHCSLALRLMSWTLVGKPMGLLYLVNQLDIRRGEGKQQKLGKMFFI